MKQLDHDTALRAATVLHGNHYDRSVRRRRIRLALTRVGILVLLCGAALSSLAIAGGTGEQLAMAAASWMVSVFCLEHGWREGVNHRQGEIDNYLIVVVRKAEGGP